MLREAIRNYREPEHEQLQRQADAREWRQMVMASAWDEYRKQLVEGYI